MVEVRQYIDANGHNPFAKWFYSLDANVQARIFTVLARLEDGNLSAIKGVGRGVFELRLDFGPGYRIYCGKDGERLVILLGGGTKKRQQTDIETAHGLWQDYKERKRAR